MFANSSYVATRFGGMSFSALKGDCDIPDEKLKQLIHEKFDKDFIGGLELW